MMQATVIPEKKRFEVATAIADDLAEQYMASNIADMYILGAADKAKEIRRASDNNLPGMAREVQEFRATSRAIYGAVCELLGGHNGYMIVKMDAPTKKASR